MQPQIEKEVRAEARAFAQAVPCIQVCALNSSVSYLFSLCQIYFFCVIFYYFPTPGKARQGSGNHPAHLREVPRQADGDLQLRRGHALHAGQASPAELAVPSPAQAQGRRDRLRAGCDGGATGIDHRRDHPLSRGCARVLGPAVRAGAADRGGVRGTEDPAGIPGAQLRPGRSVPAGVPAVDQPVMGTQG